MNINIDYPRFKDNLRIKKNDLGQSIIWCVVRKKYLILQPEELVRQLFIHYLVENGYSINRIQVEKGLVINGLKRRFDIVVYTDKVKPYMVIECKSPGTNLSQLGMDQVSRYNLALGASYLVLTNGIATFCTKLDLQIKEYSFLNQLPDPPL